MELRQTNWLAVWSERGRVVAACSQSHMCLLSWLQAITATAFSAACTVHIPTCRRRETGRKSTTTNQHQGSWQSEQNRITFLNYHNVCWLVGTPRHSNFLTWCAATQESCHSSCFVHWRVGIFAENWCSRNMHRLFSFQVVRHWCFVVGCCIPCRHTRLHLGMHCINVKPSNNCTILLNLQRKKVQEWWSGFVC